MKVDAIQIGSHIGVTSNDLIHKLDLTGRTIIFIEPILRFFEQLKKNYETASKTSNLIFLNIAISDKDGLLELYTPSQANDFKSLPSWADQLTSVNSNHIKVHGQCSDVMIETVTVPCITLNALCILLSITHIENLIIDTEGHDYEILMNLDFRLIKPVNIIFENSHMDGTFKTENGIRP